ncbi:hypothetical protein JZX87_14065 [Agrobacterium sp. Ap1]|uniref:hypothetical protein n=1 Tax=Agrobacterium sp. Ap1 TaxID=2815337 RepID=UPI001A8CCF35|nr:hypothetical protein [Agrobacterium sp. Ap1]MBO0142288.1 hypothetical protein [Agrobacterium sp. Ap1]
MIRFEPAPKITQPVGRCFRTVTERMANDMRELAFAGQNVSNETLASRGYSVDVVKRIGPKAVAMARRQSTRQIAGA